MVIATSSDNDAIVNGLFRVSLQLQRRLNQAMRAHGASLARLKVMKYVEMQDGSGRAADIADLFDQTPRTVTEMLDGLEREGLIARVPDHDDRRVKRLCVTEAGRSALAAVEPLRCAVIDEVCAVLSPAEKVDLAGLLAALGERLKAS